MGDDKTNTYSSQVPTIPKETIPEGSKPAEGNKPAEGTSKKEIPRFDASKLSISTTDAIDNAVRQNTIESDRAYRKITEDIISITNTQLEEHTNAKTPLRKKLLNFVIWLLSGQFVALVAILFLNNLISLKISDFVINVYIVSLFVETLAGLLIMIQFAFESKQEIQLIEILNEIISHFKKYGED